MNKQEFMDVQKQVGDALYIFDKFEKDGYLLDLRYIVKFYPEIEKKNKLVNENMLISIVADMLKNKKQGLEEVENYISRFKKDYLNKYVAIDRKYQNAKIVLMAIDRLTSDELELFEASYSDFVHRFHPGVTMSTDINVQMSFNNIKRFYYQNNFSSFSSLLQMNKNTFKEANIEEDKYQFASEYYYNLIGDLKYKMSKDSEKYPYNKYEVFNDDFGIENERANLLHEINELRELNKGLHNDIKEVYGEDITL